MALSVQTNQRLEVALADPGAAKEIRVILNGILNGQAVGSVADGLTASTSATQSGATAITAQLSSFTTVASAGNSAVLPAAAAGGLYIVNNATATAMTVYPASGDTINPFAANAGLTLAAYQVCTFEATTTGTWYYDITTPSPLPETQFKTGTTAAGTLGAGLITGAADCVYLSTAPAPGTLTTRTIAQIATDVPNLLPGQTWRLRIVNGTGSTASATLTAGSGVTLTGTMTIAATTWRDFVCTYTNATSFTIQNIGTGTFS